MLVIGASVAGPTAAYWMSRAGCRVTVVERCTQLRTSGQSVDIRTVGVTVMRRMAGLEEAVLTKRVPINGISIVDSDGRSFGTMSPTGDPDEQSLVSTKYFVEICLIFCMREPRKTTMSNMFLVNRWHL